MLVLKPLVEYSGIKMYGPCEFMGLNPSIKICEGESTYLLIRKWSKFNVELLAPVGKFLLKCTSIDPVGNILCQLKFGLS